MKLTIELTTDDALTVLKGLDLTDIVIKTTTAGSTPKVTRRKPKVAIIENEVKTIVHNAVEELEAKVDKTFTDTLDETGEAFAKGGAPWKS
jgi:hypothetical protein